jgi:hypothetical protein
MTKEELKLFTLRFRYQRNGAKVRNIPWQFTLEEWFDWWGTDIYKRSGQKDLAGLVMARFNDTGPYHPSNVYKATRAQNLQEQADLQRGLPGKANKPLQTPHGIFNSRKEAAEFYGFDPAQINYRLKKYPTEYYYL